LLRRLKESYRTEEALLHNCHNWLAQLEQQSGPRSKDFIQTCSLVAIFHFCPEMIIPASDRKDLTPQQIQVRLENGRKLLHRALEAELDNETIDKAA
jgi:hypothetical protein